eukprot:CAMPEP_0167782960 /NCGR_PEP_ID=MMETSP0111_2-20121227/6809_1 /TAXON_ID=91324 /ORGANISM="Lotharella globosa, Strain CCCM811" /LENGTH=291 /DNA_ID=CAMNT_0007673853 /DNA_START=2 /DNA_END=877 /DNA_ORIENTATION=-
MTDTAKDAPTCPSQTPTLFLSHGGGPLPLIGQDPSLAKSLKQLGEKLKKRGGYSSILMVSAHWEESVPTLQITKDPPLYFDYYGFPSSTYEYKYPCKPATAAVEKAKKLLNGAGIKTKEDSKRGYDHGMFVPLMLMFPTIDVPVSQISLVNTLDAAEHWKIGEALSPLRKEGVLIIGSGMSYHGFFRKLPRGVTITQASKGFDDYLATSLAKTGGDRKDALVGWEKAKHARAAHPREEHLIPLMVAAGAAPQEKAIRIFYTGEESDVDGNTDMARFTGGQQLVVSAYQFGE